MFNKILWGKIIKDFAESPLPKDIKQRDLDIPDKIPLKRSISLIGPRRCGKTYKMFLIIEKLLKKGIEVNQLLYINFESIELVGVKLEDMGDFLSVYYSIYPKNFQRELWIFLDEIQSLSGWEIFVRSLIDKGFHVYLSGSSSKLLSKEIATQMRGRNLTYEIFPLNFREYLSFHSVQLESYYSTKKEALIKNYIEKYLNWGGYPEISLYEQAKEKILNEILNVTIQKDVIERFHIRNEKILSLLVKALVNSKQFSVRKFYNFIKSSGLSVSKNTLYSYLKHLTDTMTIYLLHKYSNSYKEEERSRPKIYFIDNGILQISGIEDKGRLLENCVFVELLRRFKIEQIRYFLVGGKEVDFVILQGKKIQQLIQVSYNIDNFQTKEREFKALSQASKVLENDNLLLITWDNEGEEVFEGKKIFIVPLWKWLLKITHKMIEGESSKLALYNSE